MSSAVVIPCFNYGRYLTEAVESVVEQSARPDEIIIVDDGSTDDSRDVARRVIDAHPELSIRLISTKHSGSAGVTRNVGVEASVAEYVLCLDADDRLDAGFLQACVAVLDAYPLAAIAYGDILDADGVVHQLAEWDTRRQLRFNGIGSASLFRRVAWEDVGGYDTEIGHADWDFWIGCIEHGWLGTRAAGALWYYRVHDGMYSRLLEKDQEIRASIVLKHPSLFTDGQRRWAAGVVEGDPEALAIGTEHGVIPHAGATARLVRRRRSRKFAVRCVCLLDRDYAELVDGGRPPSVQLQADALYQLGLEVHVITCAQSADSTRDEHGVIVHEVGVPELTVPDSLGYLAMAVWSEAAAAEFSKLDAAVRFDAVEVSDRRGEALHLAPRPDTAMVVRLQMANVGVPRSDVGRRTAAAYSAREALRLEAVARADLVIAPTRARLDATATLLADRMPPGELVPEIFDVDEFPARPVAPGGDRIQALVCGGIDARRKPELALHAAAAARVQGIAVELTLLGSPDQDYRESVLLPLQSRLGLQQVHYAPCPDADTLRALLARTHVTIVGLPGVSSSLSILESLSSGVPVIAGDGDGVAKWIESESGLLLLPTGNPPRFGERAAAAIADPLWMASGRLAASRTRAVFSAPAVAERLLACYERVATAHRAA